MGHSSLLQCCCAYSRGGKRIVLSSPTMFHAVDIALSLSHLWAVALHVLCVREPLLLAIILRRDFKLIDAVNAYCEHRREMGVFMSDAIVGFVYIALGLSSVRVRAVLLRADAGSAGFASG